MGGDPGLVGASVASRYSVVRLLGDGGMGAVYKAADQVLMRFVAIKLLHRQVARDPLLVERFQREARSAAAVGHPNIIDVMDFGEDGLGPFMVMEYLRGRSLAHVIEREGRLSIERACSIAAHTLAGLSAAHQRGILHRDLKPANLMIVSRLGDRDFVKVCDFGFAAFLEPRKRAARDITPERTLVGTPSYAAPERWAGDERRDTRTDLWSVGVILHEMLAGSAGKPFAGSTVSELARRIRERPPASLRMARADVPLELERVILRALEKRPEDRWPSAAAFAEALVPFGGRRVAPQDDEESEAFDLDLLRIRDREARHATEASIELSASDLSTLELEESRIRERPVVRAFEGTVVIAVLRFLGQRFGDAAVRGVLDALPSEAREVFGAGVRPGTWVPYDAVRRLMEQIDRQLGNDDLRFVVECGRAIADGVFDRRREIEPSAPTPERHLAELPAVGPHLVRGVDYAIERIGAGHGRLEVLERTDQPSITGCVATLGFLEKSLARAGARDVEVNLISCRALGDARCLFDVSWLRS